MPTGPYRLSPGDDDRCPDCGGEVVLATSALLPGGGARPTVDHDPTCPIDRNRHRLFASDVRWLDAHPHPGAERRRHLHDCERHDMCTALGRAISRTERRSWLVCVRRHPDVPGAMVRGYYHGGRLRSAQIIGIEPGCAA